MNHDCQNYVPTQEQTFKRDSFKEKQRQYQNLVSENNHLRICLNVTSLGMSALVNENMELKEKNKSLQNQCLLITNIIKDQRNLFETK